jgi:pimeloyl-ACP methyl ester carboxylesterase
MTTFDHEQVRTAMIEDRELGYVIRDWTAVVRFQHGASSDDLVVKDGEVTDFRPSEAESATVRLVATDQAFTKLLEGDPEAFFALMNGGNDDIRLEADLIEHQAGYGRAIRRMVRVLREVAGTSVAEVPFDEDPFAASDVAVGRYVRFELNGAQYRMYYEEAGQGQPLLLQHTAGADSRQWRNVLADPELQKRYRMIAYDLPFHGRSLPPVRGLRWWEEPYEPGRDLLMQWVVEFKNALALDRPLFMGVSVGGQLASDILAHHGDQFGGAVAVNGTYHNDSIEGFDNSPFDNPRIPREYFSSMMYEATSPVAPEALRREVQWIYSSNGPGIYKGDNLYYSAGHDLRRDGHLIDTKRTPLFAVVGEYDAVNGIPGGPQEIPEHIDGARFAVLPGLSHFAMSDDPVRFNRAIAPIIDEVSALSQQAQTR